MPSIVRYGLAWTAAACALVWFSFSVIGAALPPGPAVTAAMAPMPSDAVADVLLVIKDPTPTSTGGGAGGQGGAAIAARARAETTSGTTTSGTSTGTGTGTGTGPAPEADAEDARTTRAASTTSAAPRTASRTAPTSAAARHLVPRTTAGRTRGPASATTRSRTDSRQQDHRAPAGTSTTIRGARQHQAVTTLQGVSSRGGSVVLQLSRHETVVRSVTPRPGYRVERSEDQDRLVVRFVSDDLRSTVTVTRRGRSTTIEVSER